MVMQCAYCGKKADSGRTFHQLPLNQPELLKSWLENINLGDHFEPAKSMRLCSDHFTAQCLHRTGVNVKLINGSIPTIFDTYKLACAYCSSIKTLGDNLTFYRFPLENPILLKKWILAMGKDNYKPREAIRLCSNHFDRTCFRSSGYGESLRLRNTAVPTIFPPILSEEMPVLGKKRMHESLQNSPTKHPRLATPHETAVVETAEQEMSSLEDIILASTSNKMPIPVVTTPNRTTQPTEPNTGQRLLLATHDHHYESTPRTTRRKLIVSNKKMKILQEEVRVHKQRINTLKKRFRSLKDIVSESRKTRALSDSGLACLDSIADSDVSQFLKRYTQNQKNVGEKKSLPKKRQWKCKRRDPGLGISREKYPLVIRSFAMTLHFYSPKAYGFVRRKFCNALPDPATLRAWYSTIDGEPGFASENLDALKIKVSEAKAVGEEVLVAFMLDEMGIKKGMQYSPNGIVRGYVDLGSGMERSDMVPLAKDALVMMVVALDGSWKIPIRYFFITGIDSSTNSGLVTDALIRLHDIGVTVVSVTLDGPSEHFSTMRLLGAKFDMPNPAPYFLHPSTGKKVFVIFDACHMLKLVRNCLGDRKALEDSEGNLIEWRFIHSLASSQEQGGLRAGNRIRMAHIRYQRMKMKVALAAQTLSSGVADSIEFCIIKLGLSDFQGCKATVQFIRCIDRLFDFLNSRNPLANGWKALLRRRNEVFWRPRIDLELEYLKGITDITGTPMWKTPKYVGFVGFITAAVSVIGIFDTYVKPNNSQLQYLLTYKQSQDHLELFFCAIRSCGGWCPNPICQQFVSAYKKLLVRHEVTAVNGNAEAMDSTRVLTVSSGASRQKVVDRYDPAVYDALSNIRVKKKYGLDDENEYGSGPNEFLNEFLTFHRALPEGLSIFSKACVANKSGWVVKKLVDRVNPVIRCDKCREALFQNSQTNAEFDDNALIEAKTRGGLIFPSERVVNICQYSERLLRHALNKNKCMTPKESNFPALICSKVMEDLLQTPGTLFPSLNEHLFDDAIKELSNHVYLLTKQVCNTYIRLRLFAATNLASEAAVGMKIRHHMTRQIVWQSQ